MTGRTYGTIAGAAALGSVAGMATLNLIANRELDLRAVPTVAFFVIVALVGAAPRVPLLVRAAAIGISVAALIHGTGDLLGLAQERIAAPPEFDTWVFWIEAQVAAAGRNFYDQGPALDMARHMGASEGLIPELFFWYPPMTMLLFLPLGWVDLNTGAALVYAASTAAAVGSAFLAWRLFLRDGGPAGLITAALLIVLVHPAISTVFYGQSNFVLLFFVLLFWQDVRSPRAGLWFVLANMVKPVMLPLALMFVLPARRMQLASLAAVSVIIGIATLAAFGFETTLAYLTANPTSLAPAWLYQQDVNQSLLAVVLRASGDFFTFGGPLANYLYLNLAFALIVATTFIALRRGTGRTLAMALLVTGGLMAYPGTLEHYTLVLIAPLLVIWARRAELPGSDVTAVLFIAIEFVLLAVFDGQRAFAAMLLLWVGLAALAVGPALALRIRWVLRHRPPLRTAPEAAPQ